jgi:two-component system, LytTR family, sensor kinase
MIGFGRVDSTAGGRSLTTTGSKSNPIQPAFMHPPIFLGAWMALGILFALQEYIGARSWNYHISFMTVLLAWGVHFLLWGLICQVIWWRLSERIQTATIQCILTRVVPLSIVVSVLEDVIWVACFPNLPLRHGAWSYLQRLKYYLNSELIDNLVIFWVAFFIFRGIGYYQKYRERENAAVRLETELTKARLRALRMQLHPHFLFNTMNSISCLMRTDVDAADRMLEQMCSMLRMTLDRGDAQLIGLKEEIEFIQLYLSIQKMRFRGVVHHYIAVEPEVLDAMVPTLILQSLVENAYVHGVAKTAGEAFLGIEAQRHEGKLRICIRNSGQGLRKMPAEPGGRDRVGVANVRTRLELQYGASHQFGLTDFPDGEVHATLLLPLEFPAGLTESYASYAYDNQDNHRG